MSSSLKPTIEKIRALEAEKKNLILEIEGLKKMADSKAVTLENEVGVLREEAKTLKILVNRNCCTEQDKNLNFMVLWAA